MSTCCRLSQRTPPPRRSKRLSAGTLTLSHSRWRLKKEIYTYLIIFVIFLIFQAAKQVADVVDERPSPSCSHVQRSACAIAYDSSTCSGGWRLHIPEGQIRYELIWVLKGGHMISSSWLGSDGSPQHGHIVMTWT